MSLTLHSFGLDPYINTVYSFQDGTWSIWHLRASSQDLPVTIENHRTFKFLRGIISEPFSQFDRRVFRLQDYGCVAINNVDESYEPNFRRDPLFMWPSQMKKPTLASNEMPYVPLILRRPKYEHSALRSLLLHRNWGLEFINDEKGGRWQLESSKQESWLQMQQAILLTIQIIRRYTGGFMSGLDFKSPSRLPMDYGFTKQYKSMEEAKATVLNVRGSFDLQFAFLAYHMCNSSSLISPSLNIRTVGFEGWPGWAVYALEKNLLHPVWIDMLLYGEISDFTAPRVGCYIIPRDCDWLEKVPIFLRRRIGIAFLYPMRTEIEREARHDLSDLGGPEIQRMASMTEVETYTISWAIRSAPTVYPELQLRFQPRSYLQSDGGRIRNPTC